MKGKLSRAIPAVCGLALLAACSEEVIEEATPVRPVKIFTVEGLGGNTLRRFPGTVDASQRAEMAFRIAGRLQELLVKEGDLVEEGQVLARLDPTDLQITVDDRQATFDNAQRNYTRARQLVTDGNISKIDFDQMEANFRTASAALKQAQQNLDYAELRAPFSGRIASRDVDNFEEVVAKQTVFNLQNIAVLDVRIDVPESLLRTFRGSATAGGAELRQGRDDPTTKALAEFEGFPDSRFELEEREVATRADSQTQTFEVTYTMPTPEDFLVLPGMTATVTLDFSHLADVEQSRWVPVDAVQSDASLESRVWVVDAESMTVSSRPVRVGRIASGLIEVSNGLEGGEEIVSVGAHYLAEGMAVTRMIQTEQAVPRADEQPCVCEQEG